MAIYNSGGNDYNWGMDWTPVSQTFLGIGDLLNKKKRLAYEMGDYQGGNPQFSGQPGSLTQQLAEIQKPDTTPMAQGRIQFAGQTAPGGGILDVVNGKAQLTDAGYAMPTGMGALGGSGSTPGAVTDKYINTLGQQAEKMFLADNAASQGTNKVQMTDEGYKAQTGMSREKVGSVSKGYVEKVGDEAIKQFLADDQARGGNRQEKMATAANNIRQSLSEGYRYKGPDIRAARQILMNDALATADMQRRRGDIAGYQSTVAQLYVDMQNADYGVHKDHKIKADNLLSFLTATAPRPAGGPGLKTWQVPRSINGTVVNFTVSAADPKSAIREAEAEAMRQYNTKGLGTTAVPASAGYDPSLKYAAAGNEAMKRAVEGNASPDTLRNISESTMTSVRNTPMGGSRSEVYQMNNNVGGYGVGVNSTPPVDIQSASNETAEQRRKRILGIQ